MTTALFFIAGLALLYVGGEALVRSASAIGMRFGMTPMIIGLTIVAFATSAPEAAVSIGAALNNEPGLAVGNVVGSNLCNISLLVGIVIVVSQPRLREKLDRGDVAVMALSTILVPAMLLDGLLTRIEGTSLLLAITAYIAVTVWRVHTRRSGEPPDVPSTVPVLTESIINNLLVCAIGVAFLIVGSELLVTSSIEIAVILGIPPAVVGLSAAALGTSLPELAASIIAARHNQPEMAAGNLIGSNIFNLLLVLGATSMVHPLTLGAVTFFDIAFMVGVSLLSLTLMVSRVRLYLFEGVALIATYFAYLIILFRT